MGLETSQVAAHRRAWLGPVTVLGIVAVTGSKTDRNSCLPGASMLIGRGGQVVSIMNSSPCKEVRNNPVLKWNRMNRMSKKEASHTP